MKNKIETDRQTSKQKNRLTQLKEIIKKPKIDKLFN